MRVLAVCPYAGWRELLRHEMKGKPGAEFWTFVDAENVTPEKFLTEPIIYKVDSGPFPFVAPLRLAREV